MHRIFDGGVNLLSANKCAVKTTYLFADKAKISFRKGVVRIKNKTEKGSGAKIIFCENF